MPESKPSGERTTRDASTLFVILGIALMSMGAALFHPGAGLILAGLALATVGVIGAPRRTP